MRFRVPLLALLLVAGSFALPHLAHATAIPFFGPIVPKAYNVCPASWGLLVTVINNIISFLITIGIVFVAPLMVAYSGFLYVVNPLSPSNLEKAKDILTKTIIGIVIMLAGWMVVDAIMAVLYNPGASSGTTTLQAWSSLVMGNSNDTCLPQKGALPTDSLNQVQTGVATPGLSVACSIPALPPITDPAAQQMEAMGGNAVIWTNTDPQLQKCADKFIKQVGGTVTSAYRPQAYQTHLSDIRDRWCTQDLQSNSDPLCSELRSTVSTEVDKHFGYRWSCGAVSSGLSSHTQGIGVDISGVDQSSTAAQTAAANSCLTWRNYSGDPYHYDLKSNCTCQ